MNQDTVLTKLMKEVALQALYLLHQDKHHTTLCVAETKLERAIIPIHFTNDEEKEQKFRAVQRKLRMLHCEAFVIVMESWFTVLKPFLKMEAIVLHGASSQETLLTVIPFTRNEKGQIEVDTTHLMELKPQGELSMGGAIPEWLAGVFEKSI